MAPHSNRSRTCGSIERSVQESRLRFVPGSRTRVTGTGDARTVSTLTRPVTSLLRSGRLSVHRPARSTPFWSTSAIENGSRVSKRAPDEILVGRYHRIVIAGDESDEAALDSLRSSMRPSLSTQSSNRTHSDSQKPPARRFGTENGTGALAELKKPDLNRCPRQPFSVVSVRSAADYLARASLVLHSPDCLNVARERRQHVVFERRRHCRHGFRDNSLQGRE